MPRRRWAHPCTARRTDGEPCQAWAITGATVCRVHGGSAPQVRRGAEMRLAREHVERVGDWIVAEMKRRRDEHEQEVADYMGVDVDDPRMRDLGFRRWAAAARAFGFSPEEARAEVARDV